MVLGIPLHICGQPAFSLDDKAVKRAGLDYWHQLDLSLWDSLEALMQSRREAQFFYATTKATQRYDQVSYSGTVMLVFGKETKGLPEPLLLAHPERCIRIPMRPTLRSLNLSNAVAICAYEVMRQWDFPLLDDTNPTLFAGTSI